ncbi:MAG TPA: sugar transferase [Conexibacter sp.]|jgi:exopolysaccharide biosynthesis polyprenyl glycosylphosphotransferase
MHRVANGALNVDQQQGQRAAVPLMSDRDVRRKRPPALSFLLRLATLRRFLRIVSLLALDFAGVYAALYTALLLKLVVQGEHSFGASVDLAAGQTRQFLAFAYLLTVLLFARSDLYSDRSRRPGLPRIVASLFQVTVVALVFAILSGQHFSSYYVFYSSFAFSTVYVSSLRWLHTQVTGWMLSRAGYARRALLVGSGKQIDQVAHALAATPGRDIHPVGYISLTPRPDNGLRSLGSLADLGTVLDRDRVQEVIIADPDFPQEHAVELVDQCHRRGIEVHVAPSTMEILVQRAEFMPGQSLPLFTLKPPVFEGIDFALKRSFDLLVASLSLLVLSPLLIVCALAVKLTSRGPVFYRSIRPGIGGMPFACLKFRTMVDDHALSEDELEGLNEAGGALFKIRDDPRVTQVGRILRRYSLDELPQLINVVRGQMSLVGPRPLPLRDFEKLEEWHKKRYLVLPGITGLWQVSGRSELDFDDLVRLDFVYLERWSVALDLVILLKTIPAVLLRRGAY